MSDLFTDIQKWIWIYTLHLNPLLQKLAKVQKAVFLLGDFNVDLLKCEQHKATNEFLDLSLSSNMFFPHIVQPNRITSHSKTLIDNIFSNYISQDTALGNLTETIYKSFTTTSHWTSYFFKCSKQENKHFWTWLVKIQSRRIHSRLLLSILASHIKTSEQHWCIIPKFFFVSISNILDKDAPFKKITKDKLEPRAKPWITPT